MPLRLEAGCVGVTKAVLGAIPRPLLQAALASHRAHLSAVPALGTAMGPDGEIRSEECQKMGGAF